MKTRAAICAPTFSCVVAHKRLLDALVMFPFARFTRTFNSLNYNVAVDCLIQVMDYEDRVTARDLA
jgi:hypothetical protein